MTRAELKAEQADCVARMSQTPDVFHPDARVAAAFADLSANRSAEGYLGGEITRCKDRLKRDPGHYWRERLCYLKATLKLTLAERPELERMVAVHGDPVVA